MKKTQISHLYMFKAVYTVLNKYESILSTVPTLMQAQTTFKENLSRIESTQLIQEGQVTGVAKQKQKEEDEMIAAVLIVAAALYVYAQDTNNLELLDKVHVGKNIKNLSDSRLIAVCRNIMGLAIAVGVENLSPYGLPADALTNLDKEINDFVQLVTQPRSEVVTRSQATALLDELFKETNSLLRGRMDKLLQVQQTEHPEFYNEYRAARVIVDISGTKSPGDEEEE